MLIDDILDLNSTTLQREAAGNPIVEAIDRALLAKEAATEPRRYLGGSFIASDCERAIQYQYEVTPVDPGKEFPANVLRIFKRGHAMEDWVADWLRDAGFMLKTADANGYQFGFSSCGGKFKGHADGVLIGWQGEGPAPVAMPALWENKAVNDKTWNQMVRLGVKKTKPVYYGQVALYQHYLQLEENPAVFTIVNANTMQLHVELIPFDAAECQRLIDRAARIIPATEAGDRLPRGSADPDSFVCRFCNYKERCWA